jgi:hypothetical protein
MRKTPGGFCGEYSRSARMPSGVDGDGVGAAAGLGQRLRGVGNVLVTQTRMEADVGLGYEPPTEESRSSFTREGSFHRGFSGLARPNEASSDQRPCSGSPFVERSTLPKCGTPDGKTARRTHDHRKGLKALHYALRLRQQGQAGLGAVERAGEDQRDHRHPRSSRSAGRDQTA